MVINQFNNESMFHVIHNKYEKTCPQSSHNKLKFAQTLGVESVQKYSYSKTQTREAKSGPHPSKCP